MYRRLRYIRESKEKMQSEIANIINVVQSQYSLYESERVSIPIKHLITLCNYFDVSLDYIFEFTNIQKYPNIKEYDYKLQTIRLKEFRKEHNLTQTKLASILNTTFTTISSYERGINIISTNYLYTICSKYNLSADYLLGRIDTPKYIKIKN